MGEKKFEDFGMFALLQKQNESLKNEVKVLKEKLKCSRQANYSIRKFYVDKLDSFVAKTISEFNRFKNTKNSNLNEFTKNNDYIKKLEEVVQQQDAALSRMHKRIFDLEMRNKILDFKELEILENAKNHNINFTPPSHARVLVVLEILFKRTNKSNGMLMCELVEEVEKRGLSCSMELISSDLSILYKMGYPIATVVDGVSWRYFYNREI